MKALEMAFACLSYIAFLAFVLGESKDEWEEDGLGLSPTGCHSQKARRRDAIRTEKQKNIRRKKLRN